MRDRKKRNAVGAPMMHHDYFMARFHDDRSMKKELTIEKSVDLSTRCLRPTESSVVVNFAQATGGIFVEIVHYNGDFEWLSQAAYLISLKEDLQEKPRPGDTLAYADRYGFTRGDFLALLEQEAPGLDPVRFVPDVARLMDFRGYDFCEEQARKGHFPLSLVKEILEVRFREWDARHRQG